MKTFFATAAIAASANAMTGNEIGELIAGIFYEIGIDSSLDDFSHCMSDGYVLEQDISDAVAQFEHGGTLHITKGVRELIDAVHHLPEAFHGCTHMFDDIAAIAEWTAIIAHPAELKQKIERNTALHILKLKKDVSALKEEFAADEYFKAGETIGNILTLELGKVPLSNSAEENLTIPQIYDVATLVSGIIYGVSDQGSLEDLSECLVDADKIEQDVENALGDLFHGKIADAVADLSLISTHLPDATSQCTQIQSDLHALEDWLAIVKDFDALKSRIEKNTALHILKIKRDIKSLKADVAAEEYFQAGEVIADLLLIELGKMPAPHSATYGFGLDDTYNLIAGLIYGLVGDNYLPEIETCAGNISNLTNDVETAIADFNIGSYQSVLDGLYYLGLALQELPQDFTNCSSGLQDDLSRIGDWAHIFIEPVQLAEDVSKNIITNPIKAERDLHRAKKDWNKPDYFAFGEDVADILVLAVGPVPASVTEILQ